MDPKLKDYFSKIGKTGGTNRWKKMTAEQRKRHMEKMNKASHKLSTDTLDG
jgi:uncharacterized protein YbjQ (UPF0145 family)